MSLPPRARRRRLVVPRGSLADGQAPFDALDHLDAGRHGARHIAALVLAFAAHAVLGGAVAFQHSITVHPPPIVAHPPIQATLQAPPRPTLPPPEPKVTRPPLARSPRPNRAPPSPAQAGHVLTQTPTPDGPADLTGFDLVVGSGTSYGGGYTSAQGKSKGAVAAPDAVVGGVPDATPDLSRPASPLRRDWACAWPDEAQDTELRDARATIRVSVGKDGSPDNVEVVSAPPGGFGEAARRCAERERYRPALDATGKPIAADTHLFNVHFLR